MGVTGQGTARTDSTSTGFVFEEVKEAPFFRFEKPGQQLEGYLVSLDPVVVGENKTRTIAYTVELFQGGRMRFLGTKNLNDKLSPQFMGMPIRVKYVSDNAEAGRQGNAMKVFYVGIDKDPKR